MRHWGYSDAQVTRGGADGGVDVRSARALAQVKYEAAHVGAPAIQRLVGARGLAQDQSLFFFTGAGYARPAVEYADMMGIALFYYHLDGSMVPINAAAGAVVSQARSLAAENLPVDDIRRWASAAAAAADRDVQRAQDSGWWRRNGWLAWSILCGLSVLMSAGQASGLSEPAAGDEPAGWWAVFGFLVMSIGSYLLWRYLANRRAARAETLALVPDPGPIPPVVRILGAGLPGTRPGASAEDTDKAMQEFMSAVPGLSYNEAWAIVRALQQEGQRAPRS